MEAVLEQAKQIGSEETTQTTLSIAKAGDIALGNETKFSSVVEELTYAELVSENLWQRLTSRIEKDETVDNETAQRMMNESLAFLKACADNPGVMLSPSEKVDVGWHTFILYTKDYADFCENTAGSFIHHEPNDIESTEESESLMTAADTYNLLTSQGYKLDSELWLTDAQRDGSRCNSHCRNTCGNH